MTATVQRILWPPTKLENLFPWGWRQASKEYGKSLLHFFVGSLVVPLLVLGSVFALVYYWPLHLLFLELTSAVGVLVATFVLGAAGTWLGTYWLGKRAAARKGKSAPARVGRKALYAVIGGLLLVDLLLIGMLLLHPHYPQVMKYVAEMLSDKDGNPSMTFVMVLSTVSFVLGFSMQMRSIGRSLNAMGVTLRRFMALHVDTRRGSRWYITAFNVAWPAVLAIGIWQPIEWLVTHFLGASQQPTTDMARAATGGNFLMFAVMAAIGAPIFEELVFRGFVFNVVRGSLKNALPALELVAIPESGSYLGFRQAWARLDNLVRRKSDGFGRWIHGLLGRRAELSAILISSFLFAVLHMQFNPTTLVLLFLLGCLHAEVYRRTGCLYCSMLMHAINNGMAVYFIAMGG